MTQPTAPSEPPQHAPASDSKRGRYASLALAVAIAAVGGFILARLGAGAPAVATPPTIAPGLAARVNAIHAEGIPSREVLEALRTAQVRRHAPGALALPEMAPDPRWLEQVQTALRPKLTRCLAEGGPHGTVVLRGMVRDVPAHLSGLSILEAPPELATAATCVAAALDGAPVPALDGPAADAPVALRFDL
jgi:hypothetical protein